MANSVAIIVDAFSTGARLADEFKKYGINCAHIQSSADIPLDMSSNFRATDFFCAFTLDQYFSINHLRAMLYDKNVLCVIPGTETGVEAAERIARGLGLAGNDPKTSELRRDKFCMHRALRKVGLSDIKQVKCYDTDSAVAWATDQNCWPLVVKPVASAGADGVTFCYTKEEVRAACDKIIGHKNKLGLVNDSVVLQERIVGQQFIVNAVSLNGKHFISEIWRDEKCLAQGASLICDREILLNSNDPFADSVSQYVIKCLDTLGITDGPSHSELFQREDGRFILIETAARMQGTIDDKAVIEATGHSHVTLTAMRYAEQDKFSALIGTQYVRNNHLHCISLCSGQVGIVKQNQTKEKIARVPSFRSLIHTPAVGDAITKTIDLFTNPGIVYLAHRDESILRQDYETIRQMERNNELFLVE